MTRNVPWWTRLEFDRFGVKLRSHWGTDGDGWTPYQTVLALGRLRFHCFHRGDQDEHCHDHMWDFATFPLTSYVEQVFNAGLPTKQVVRAFRVHKRSAEYAHRLLGKWNGHLRTRAGPVWTIVVVGEKRREWGFWIPAKHLEVENVRDKSFDYHYAAPRWIPWKHYVYGGVR